MHVACFAEKAGLDAAQLASLAVGRPTDDCRHTTDRAVLEAVDELHATEPVSAH